MIVDDQANDTETEEVSSKVVVAENGELAVEYFAEVKEHVGERAAEAVEQASSSQNNQNSKQPVRIQGAVPGQELEEEIADDDSYNEPSYNQEDQSEASAEEYEGTYYQPSQTIEQLAKGDADME